MQTIMSLCAEWFDHSVVTIKDNKKHFFWQCEGDDDMIEMISYRGFEEISEAGNTFPELDDLDNDGEPESDYLTEEWEEEDEDE